LLAECPSALGGSAHRPGGMDEHAEGSTLRNRRALLDHERPAGLGYAVLRPSPGCTPGRGRSAAPGGVLADVRERVARLPGVR